MKKIFLIILSLTIFTCKDFYAQSINETISKRKTNKIKARLILCTGLSEKRIPLNNLKEIKVKEGDKIYFYTKWFNLAKGNHVTSVEFLDEDNNTLVQSNNYKFKSKKNTHNTWNSRRFREVLIPAGILKIRMIMDEKIILERKINVKYLEK